MELNSVFAPADFQLPVCPQCGFAFAILMPQITDETKSDKRCPDCASSASLQFDD